METILINGQPQHQLSVTDRAFHYGDGLFETLSVLDGSPRFWARHMARLNHGCQSLNIPVPDIQQLYSEVSQLAKGAQRCIVKIIISRGSGGRGYRPPQPANPTRAVMCYPYPDYPASYGSEGIALRLCETRLGCNPRLAGIKHLNRLEQVLARSEWEEDGIVEGVMLDARGYLVEGTMSNLFIVKDGELYTPDLSRCGVEGIMRGVVLELAHQQQLPVHIAQLPVSLLEQADEIFVTNSVIGLWPVKSCGEQHYAIGPLTQQLQHRLMPLLESSHA